MALMNYKEPFLPPTANGRPRKIPPPRLDPETGCWEWQASVACGYGKMGGPGSKPQWAHRVYYEHIYGPIPKRHQVHHLCENRLCVNPAHLRALSPRKHGQVGNKLDIQQAREIRRRLIEGERNIDLATEFGVSKTMIGEIKAGRAWQDKVTCPNCTHRFDPFEFD